MLMYMSESLNFNHREYQNFDLESISVEINIGKYKPFLVTTIYRPSDRPVTNFGQIESFISTAELEGKESTLIGDLNGDFLCESKSNTKSIISKNIIYLWLLPRHNKLPVLVQSMSPFSHVTVYISIFRSRTPATLSHHFDDLSISGSEPSRLRR